MKKFSKDQKALIEVILSVMISDAGFDVKDYQPGIAIKSLDNHKVYLTISRDSQFYDALKQHLDFSESRCCYKSIDEMGYSDCVTWTTPTPPDNIFTVCGSGMRWHTCRGCGIDVDINNIYVDFEEINRVILKFKQVTKYNLMRFDLSKLIDKIKYHIDEGRYDVNEYDEYM